MGRLPHRAWAASAQPPLPACAATTVLVGLECGQQFAPRLSQPGNLCFGQRGSGNFVAFDDQRVEIVEVAKNLVTEHLGAGLRP